MARRAAERGLLLTATPTPTPTPGTTPARAPVERRLEGRGLVAALAVLHEDLPDAQPQLTLVLEHQLAHLARSGWG